MTTTSPDETALDPRSPRARLTALFDEGSLDTITADDDSGVLVGVGRMLGTNAVAFACDPTIQGGAMGIAGCTAIVTAYDRALLDGVPIVGLWHSGGARLREGVESLDGVGRVFAAMTRASGKVPQISVVLGPAAGGAAYGPALTDIVIMGPAGRIFVTGPDVVRSVTGEDVDMERLGGAEVHGRRSGVVHIVTDSEEDALERARALTDLLGNQGKIGDTEVIDANLESLLPEGAKRAYDVHPLINGILDSPGVELHAKWAPNIVTVLGRLGGRTVGVVANNPLRLGGCLDATSAEKAARFVRTCDAFGVPLVVVVDVPGLPARTRTRVGRRGAPRCETAARVRRGGRAAGHPDYPQGVRRRLHRDELAVARCHVGARVARSRGCGYGVGRRGPHLAPPQAGRSRRSPAAFARARARSRAREACGKHRQGGRDRRGRPCRVASRDAHGDCRRDCVGACTPRIARQHPAVATTARPTKATLRQRSTSGSRDPAPRSNPRRRRAPGEHNARASRAGRR